MTPKEEWIAFYITRDNYRNISERDKLSTAWDEALKNKQKIFSFTSVKCTKASVERYTLREKSWWADIMISPDGFVNIQSDYGNYHYRWGEDIKKFLIGCDKSYLYNKFGGLLPRVFNRKETIKRIRKDIIKMRRGTSFAKDVARKAWNALLTLEEEYYSTVERWSAAIECSDLPKAYDYDLSSMPCVTEDDYQLTAFLTIIWPEFIKNLKNEI